MDQQRQQAEVERNYDAFVRALGGIIADHRDQLVLMRDGRIIDFFDRPADALRGGMERFPDGIFSIQEVTDEPIDLGFWSHVGN